MRLVRYSYPSYRTFAPALTFQRSPWSGLESEINRVFEAALADMSGAPADRFPVDLYEDKANTYVRAELPGVSRDDISVEVVDGYLTITATRKTPAAAAPAEGEAQPEDSFTFTRSV